MEKPINSMKKRNSLFLVGIVLLFSLTFTSAFNFETGGVKIIDPLEENGGIPVNIQDQTTRPFAIRINQILNNNISLNQSPTVDTYTLILNPGHGVVAGDSIAFLEQNGMPQLLFGEVLSVSTNTITMDSLVPYSFIPENTVIFTYDNSLISDGSGSPEIYTITNFFDEAIDITRVIFHCTDNAAMDDAKFCGLSELNRGILFRKKLTNGNYINYWNVKNNGDWGQLAFDKSYDDKAPAGFYGFGTRLTYGGQSKHGVVIRLDPGESIELVNQDDLTNLNTANLMVEGHFIQN